MEKDILLGEYLLEDNKLSARDVKQMLEDLNTSDLNHVVLKYQITEDSIKDYVRESPEHAKALSWVLEDSELKSNKPYKLKTKSKSKSKSKTQVSGGYVSKQHPKFIIQNINLDDFNLSEGDSFLINNKLYLS